MKRGGEVAWRREDVLGRLGVLPKSSPKMSCGERALIEDDDLADPSGVSPIRIFTFFASGLGRALPTGVVAVDRFGVDESTFRTTPLCDAIIP